uniref:Sperm-tail PG-rich repeat-containing protein 2 n=1 Tax=Magallana gigas TaxID=29159 RepID=A0A8W8IEC1_MAGGI
MYDRAPRDLVKTFGSTPGNVGPGSYDSNVLPRSKIKADGYAPFLSMTSRETFLNVSDQVVAAPGPGHYDPQNAQDGITGGKTLANKSKRFMEQIPENPGPGTYSTERYTDFRSSKSAPGSMQNKGNAAGSLLTSRIKFHRKPEAPSIPMPGQAYGYEECEDGTLKKQDPPDKDKSIGPAFYNPTVDPTKATKTYQGVHFSKYSSKRLDLSKGRLGPGPGDYEPFQNRYQNMTAQFSSVTSRLKDPPTVVKEMPPPGSYEVAMSYQNSQLQGTERTKPRTDEAKRKHGSFLSAASRFAPPRDVINHNNDPDLPGPGAYDSKEGLARKGGLMVTKDKRFKDLKSEGPGPGSYEFSPLVQDTVLKGTFNATLNNPIAPQLDMSQHMGTSTKHAFLLGV